MPVLRSSASDFTNFVKQNATLPTNGKATTSTVPILPATRASVSSLIKLSAVAAKSSPSTTALTTKIVKSK